MNLWAREQLGRCSAESSQFFIAVQKNPAKLDDPEELRAALLEFVADFANWDNSSAAEFLNTSRALTHAAQMALQPGGRPRPLVVDPFAGGGAIPIEGLRIGADVFASDINPVAVLLNEITLDYLPNLGASLSAHLAKYSGWISDESRARLAEFYPKDPDGSTPIAYLWARVIRCEGPSCGHEVPLIRTLSLSQKRKRAAGLILTPNHAEKRVRFQVVTNTGTGWMDVADPSVKVEKPSFEGTVRGGSATCPACGYTTPVASVRVQLRERRGGAQDARLMCVVTTRTGQPGRFYRPGTEDDEAIADLARRALDRLDDENDSSTSIVPREPLPVQGTLGFRLRNYGVENWGDIYSPRQALALATLTSLVREAGDKARSELGPKEAAACQALLAISVSRLAGRLNSLCWWRPQADQEKIELAFSGQTVPMKWDFAEGCPLTEGTAGWVDACAAPMRLVDSMVPLNLEPGSAFQANAASHPLPDDSADAFITDPPYYDAVPYAALSDFFYVWLKRALPEELRGSFETELTPKEGECIVDPGTGKDRAHYEDMMSRAMGEGRRVLAPSGIGVVVFAHKSTAGWEAQLQAMIDAGWIVTGSWPIDTEQGARIRANNSAALASSVHIVCRPRENPDGSLREDAIGDWREVLAELPTRIHAWMPRLAEEGIVGADAIFACLGPALEIFSRYSAVEKASGENVGLGEYLGEVWAAVSREALSMIFKGADASGFEEDARLTAMWLWTLHTSSIDSGKEVDDGERATVVRGYGLEFDAARKIAQGLGVHLESLDHLVEVKGGTATLLSAGARAKHLFGKKAGESSPAARKNKPQLLLDFGNEIKQLDEQGRDWTGDLSTGAGSTVLDRLHQAMILFGAGRGEAMRRLLVDEGAGQNSLFWRLAQALSALYPTGTEEKRWVDGVLARKKGLGL